MRLIVISSSGTVPEEAAVLRALFEQGLETFHLRKPGLSRPEMEAYLDTVSPEHRRRVVLHSHARLAERYGVKGIHGPPAALPFTDRGRITRSRSLHSLEELAREPDGYDYLFLSPVFDSISKRGYRAAFDRRELALSLKETKRRSPGTGLIALGGIDSPRLEQVRELGFDGAAALGAVWRRKGRKAVETFTEMQRTICGMCTY